MKYHRFVLFLLLPRVASNALSKCMYLLISCILTFPFSLSASGAMSASQLVFFLPSAFVLRTHQSRGFPFGK
ncbi:hypothetical protein JHK87_019803 [Glycine soja]|nr:hypothetical protein JHK87_019803 [Glycine soja]